MREYIKKNIFDHRHYADIAKLVELKRKKGLTISLAFPTLNEEANIGMEIEVVRRALVQQFPLIDEVAIVDSGSTDRTRDIARYVGADVHLANDIFPEFGHARGKGENLWKSIHALKGDIIVWADADIENFHTKFVYGLIGPLLENDDLMFVKAFYERPLAVGEDLLGSGGGRVTEILVRPLFGCFYPELSWMFQPCAGEYAGRRELLEKLPFATGYGVETGLLVDIYEQFGMDVIGQVNLNKRIHRNRDIEALSKMSFEIIHAFVNRLSNYDKIDLRGELKDEFVRVHLDKNDLGFNTEFVQISERPPMESIPAYKEQRKLCKKWSSSGTAKRLTIV